MSQKNIVPLPDDREFENFENMRNNDSLKKVIELSDFYENIFKINDNNVEEIQKKIENKANNINDNERKAHFFDNIYKKIEYAIKIRFKEMKNLFRLISLLNKKNKYKIPDNCSKDFRAMLIYNGIIDRKPCDSDIRSEEEITKIFPEKTLGRFIMDDDYNEFINLTVHPDFDFDYRIIIDEDNILFDFSEKEKMEDFREKRTGTFTIMQLIALCGSIKCFNYSFLVEKFTLENIEKYAIAGGNNEIIKKLKVQYNNCLRSAVMFHRENLFNWLIKEDCAKECVSLPECAIYENFLAYHFYSEMNCVPYVHQRTLLEAVSSNNLASVMYYINLKEEDPNTVSQKKHSVLYMAAQQGYYEIAKFLIDSKADIHFRDKESKTLLHVASYGGHLPVVKLLCEKEKEIAKKNDSFFNICDYVDNHGSNAFDSCIPRDNIEVFRYFMEEKYINDNYTNKNGYTVLDTAVFRKSYKIINYLVNERGHDLNAQGKGGKTVLHSAAFKGDLDMVRFLIGECGMNVEIKDEFGDTPLHSAAYSGKLEMVKLLVEEYHANINAKNRHNRTPFSPAFEK